MCSRPATLPSTINLAATLNTSLPYLRASVSLLSPQKAKT